MILSFLKIIGHFFYGLCLDLGLSMFPHDLGLSDVSSLDPGNICLAGMLQILGSFHYISLGCT